MKKDVLLSISGLHLTDDSPDGEPIEVIAPAEYYIKNGKQHIFYDEVNDDDKNSTKVHIKISSPTCVEITKNGSSSMHMLFEQGKKNLSCYNTPFGSITIAILTHGIELEQKEEELSLQIHYLLEANYEPMADCTLSLRVTDKDAALFSLS